MKNKWIAHISKIMSKSYGVLTENLTVSFLNAGKARDVSEFEFDKPSFGDDLNVTFIS